VHVSRHELGKRIDHGNDGLVEIFVFHSSRTP
jgi:hypothetical protein